MAAASVILIVAAIGSGPPASNTGQVAPASRPFNQASHQSAASQPASRPDDPLIESLIAELGASDFRRRTAAQNRLIELGAAALPGLIRHVNDPSPEIAERVQAIVQVPVDPEMCVDLAVALLATRRPEKMERGVYMMFDKPELCCELFLARVSGMQGRDRAVGEAVAEQFRTWRGQYTVFLRHYEKMRKRSEESAAKILKLQTDGNAVNAEAAYQLALEALESTDGRIHDAGQNPAATQPALRAGQAPTSQRS